MNARSWCLLLVALLSVAIGAQSPAAVQTPEAAFGFRMGTDRELADWPSLQRYFESTAAASDRVELVEAGPTTEGRQLIAAIVSSPANIARLDQIRTNALRLADPRTLDDKTATDIIERQPVIVAIGMSIHATGIGGTQTAPELLHLLATSTDQEITRSLDSVLLILIPSLNPDGHAITVDWYRKWKGTAFDGASLPGLDHKYAGDLNRDGFMMNVAESRSLADFFYRRWHPQVFLTMNQMESGGPLFSVLAGPDHIDRTYDPLISPTTGLLGSAIALALAQDGRSAAATGGRWRLRDIVDYNLSAARGLLGAAARYREDLVRNFHRMAKRQIEIGAKGGPFAFVIPPDQFDPHATRKLEQLLIDGVVEIHRTLEPFRIADTVYNDGADIIMMAQPNRAYAKTLLEVQQYPARQSAGAVTDRPYDVAGWTLPLQMNVRVDRIDQYFEPPPATKLDRASIAPSKVWGDVRKSSFFVIDGRGNGASIAINRLLKAGARVSFLTSALPIQGYTYQPGAIMAMESKGVRETVDTIARELGLRATASTGRAPTDARSIGRTRVGLYKSFVDHIDEGWTRWLLEQYEFEFETIVNGDIKRGGLRTRFDAIILPDQDAARITGGHPAGTMPPEYVGGIGTDGADMLRQFVNAGGTLIAFDSASEFAISLLAAPIADATRGATPDQFSCPGSIVRIELENDPLTFGLPRETAGFCAYSTAFDVAAPSGATGGAASTARIIGRYATTNVLLSGWLQGDQRIAGKGAIAEVRSGQGRAVLFAFRPQHRAQSHATFRLLFNAIHTSK